MASKGKRSWLEPPSWWKKWKPLRWIAIVVVLFSLASMSWTVKNLQPASEHADTALYTSIEDQRVNLGGFRSYDSVETVRAALAAGNFTVVQSPSYSAPSASYPAHKMDTLTVEKYLHLDQPGLLTLEFFNDRLYEVDFAPVGPKTYAVALHKALTQLKGNQAGDTEWINGSLRVSSNVDLAANAVGQSLGTHAYVIWQDLRLIRQRDQWDKNFSAAPTQSRKGFGFR